MAIQSSKPLIGLCGYKGVGKDTVAGHLVKFYDFERRAFADKLKEAVANLFDIPFDKVDELKMSKDIVEVAVVEYVTDDEYEGSVKHGHSVMSWRELLQRFGTEMGRNTFGSDFWVNLAISKPFTKPTVFTDARFANEQSVIKALGGKIVWIERRGYTSDGHASEQKPPVGMINYVIHNDDDFIKLFEETEEMMRQLYGSDPIG